MLIFGVFDKTNLPGMAEKYLKIINLNYNVNYYLYSKLKKNIWVDYALKKTDVLHNTYYFDGPPPLFFTVFSVSKLLYYQTFSMYQTFFLMCGKKFQMSHGCKCSFMF